MSQTLFTLAYLSQKSISFRQSRFATFVGHLHGSLQGQKVQQAAGSRCPDARRDCRLLFSVPPRPKRAHGHGRMVVSRNIREEKEREGENPTSRIYFGTVLFQMAHTLLCA
jgi:hypothetical protein